MNYILGIDIGTTNTKAVAYTVEGKTVAHANKSYTFSSREEGCHEIDPDILLEAVIEVAKSAVTDAREHTLSGVSFSAAMHGIMAVNAQGKPLTQMITWADLRSNEYAAKLKNTEQGRRIYERTGTPIHPMSPLCKLMWMKDNLPEIFRTAHKFISIKEYIFYHFFGEYIIDHSIASASGLFDIYDLRWNQDALGAAGTTAERLSSPVPVTHIIKGLRREYALTLNIDPQTPFIIGASDGCLAHIGSNAISHRDVSFTIGTSGAVRVMTDEPVHDTKQRVFNYILDENVYISGGPINNGGNLLQWFATNMLRKSSMKADDFNEFIDEAVQVPAGCEGLIFLPYVYGERAPVWDADARGVFYGVSGTHTISHFMRSILEGISFALYGILNTLEEITGPVNNIYVSGGFIKSPKWVSLVADVLGKKLLVTQAEDSSAAGAAIIAMKALGIINSFDAVKSFFEINASYEPDIRNHEACKKNYAVYANLYDQLKDIKK
jgi:gluconokinase